MSRRTFAVIALAVCLVLAGVVSYYASNSPDGLNHVANTLGIGQEAKPSSAHGPPLSGYHTQGVADRRLSGGLAGILGVGVTLLLALGLTYAVRRRSSASRE